MAAGLIGNTFGIPYLFVDPEYMGKVGFFSFFIMGFAVGSFVMVYNISSYIINGFRFSFIATLSKPFMKYALNNFIAPAIFILTYISRILYFQIVNEYQDPLSIILCILGFLLGIAVIIGFTLTYFFRTNKDIIKMYGVDASDADPLAPIADHLLEDEEEYTALRSRNKNKLKSREWRVDTYLSTFKKVKLVRKSEHYSRDMVEAVFRQNHLNAAIIEIVVFGLFIVMGIFKDYTLFKIPAAASLLLLFSMLIMLSSAFRFWLKSWSFTLFAAILMLLNFFSQYGIFYTANKAFGLDYTAQPAPYSYSTIKANAQSADFTADSTVIINTLNLWRNKFYDPTVKPKMIFVNVTGGGLRASMWAFRVMQVADSLSTNQFIKSTQLIAGASGGMIGATYYREMFLKKQLGLIKDHRNDQMLLNTGKDLLNPITFSITVSDLFFNIREFKDGKNAYSRDRAFSFEKEMNNNFGNIFTKRLRDYFEPESRSLIPMIIYTPTIVSDGRKLIISALPASYLSRNKMSKQLYFESTYDDVEFTRFLKKQDAGNTKITSILRMNATFPYILPAVTLPTIPAIKIMDAGIRDNFGYETSLKFISTFYNWIENNTSGIILIEIRDNKKFRPLDGSENRRTLFENFITPLGNVYGNLLTVQEYKNDESIIRTFENAHLPVDVIRFELPTKENEIGLSWHLTTRDKKNIFDAINTAENKASMAKLQYILKKSAQ